MKVLHVTHGYHPDPGGVESYLRMVVGAQRAAGDDVVVLAGSIEPREACEIVEHDVEGTRVLRLHRDDWYNDHYAHCYHPGASRLIREVLASERPDVVHLHQWIRLTSDIVQVAHGHGTPIVVTVHDVYTSCPRAFRIDREEQPCDRPLCVESCASCVPRFGHESEHEVATGIQRFRGFYRNELETADRVLVAAGVTADLLHRTTGIGRERFTVQDLPYRKRFAGLRAPADGNGVLSFGYWGSLTPHKGPHVLLEAFRGVASSSTTPVELHLFGPLATEELRARLETMAEGLPVTLHGAFDAEQLAAAGLDVAVFPVICFEGFGLGLAEAFELGIPAIVSDIGALAERIGGAGLKVPPGDVAALTAAMERMANDAKLRTTCAAEIPDLPGDPDTHVAQLREHYTSVVQSRPLGKLELEGSAEFLVMQRESYARALRDARGRRDPQ